jgi:Cysteine rich repeat
MSTLRGIYHRARILRDPLAIIVCAIGFSGAAVAQTPAADRRGACKADYEKFCAGTAPGTGHIVPCLSKQREQLSDACRKALDSRKK